MALTVAGGLALPFPASLATWTGLPRPWAPFPIVLLAPIAKDYDILVWLTSILFWTLGVRLLLGHSILPFYSALVLLLLAIANGLWLALCFRTGKRYQRPAHTGIVVLANAVFSGTLVGIAWRGRRRPSYAKSYAFHWLLAAWIAWYAFPYLGIHEAAPSRALADQAG